MFAAIEDIEVADADVISTEIDSIKRSVTITFSSSYFVSEQRRLGPTTITVSDWTDFTNVKHIYDHLAEKTTIVFTKEYAEMETFRFLQLMESRGIILVFSGWSKETGNWISYEFTNAKASVTF